MVVGQILGWKLSAAVLADVLVPGVNVLPGKSHRNPGALDEPEQPDYSGQFNREAYGAYFSGVLLQPLDLAHYEQCHGAPPVDHFQRFVGDIEK